MSQLIDTRQLASSNDFTACQCLITLLTAYFTPRRHARVRRTPAEMRAKRAM